MPFATLIGVTAPFPFGTMLPCSVFVSSTYAVFPSGVMTIDVGAGPTLICGPALFAAVVTGVTQPA